MASDFAAYARRPMPLHPVVEEWDAGLRGGDPLGFPGYGGAPVPESVLTGRTERYALIEGRFDVLGGSMGAVHGERVVRAYRRAVEDRLPVVIRAASGGARMQEGMVSLIQLARTSAAARAHARAGLLSVAVLHNPTTGGVYASYASLADLRAAVAGATVGFAGPRVVELTTGEPLPEGSHTAESAFRAGLIDALVANEDHESIWVDACLGSSGFAQPAWERPESPAGPLGSGAWAEVLASRRPGRTSPWSWAQQLFHTMVELRGPDPVVRAALGTIGDHRRVVVVAVGRGAPGPAGYRLVQRALALAARLSLPVVTFVDTRGADPGPASEAGGVAGEIARTFAAMSELPAQSVAICTGEGGSGGALAVAAADRLLLLEHSIFSVIAPEGAAAILDRDPATAPERAEHLKLTAPELLALGVIDAVVAEDVESVRAAVTAALDDAVPGDGRRRFDAATARWVQ